jgi:hypothetical protein
MVLLRPGKALQAHQRRAADTGFDRRVVGHVCVSPWCALRPRRHSGKKPATLCQQHGECHRIGALVRRLSKHAARRALCVPAPGPGGDSVHKRRAIRPRSICMSCQPSARPITRAQALGNRLLGGEAFGQKAPGLAAAPGSVRTPRAVRMRRRKRSPWRCQIRSTRSISTMSVPIARIMRALDSGHFRCTAARTSPGHAAGRSPRCGRRSAWRGAAPAPRSSSKSPRPPSPAAPRPGTGPSARRLAGGHRDESPESGSRR